MIRRASWAWAILMIAAAAAMAVHEVFYWSGAEYVLIPIVLMILGTGCGIMIAWLIERRAR